MVSLLSRVRLLGLLGQALVVAAVFEPLLVCVLPVPIGQDDTSAILGRLKVWVDSRHPRIATADQCLVH